MHPGVFLDRAKEGRGGDSRVWRRAPMGGYACGRAAQEQSGMPKRARSSTGPSQAADALRVVAHGGGVKGARATAPRRAANTAGAC